MSKKAKPNEDDRRSIEEKVSIWLGETGYRLEYLAYRAFREVGISVGMSAFLESPEGKPREIDLLASESDASDSLITVSIVCECKYLDHPWVLLHSDVRTSFQAVWELMPQSAHVGTLWSFLKGCGPDFSTCWHFSADTPCAHSIVQALKPDNRDAAYNAIQKISNAAWDFAEMNDKEGLEAMHITIPCIIVDSPLLAASFDHDKGKFSSEKITRGRMLWAGCRSGTIIDIVHITALEEYASDISRTIRKVIEALYVAKNKLAEKKKKLQF
jgi:hypothetical protein